MKKLIPLLLPLFVFIASPVNAGDGNHLLNDCKEAIAMIDTEKREYNSLEWATCFGCTRGVTQLYSFLTDIEVVNPRFCLSSQTNTSQLIRIIVKNLKEHPEELHHPAPVLVLNALNKAFPCTEQQSPK